MDASRDVSSMRTRTTASSSPLASSTVYQTSAGGKPTRDDSTSGESPYFAGSSTLLGLNEVADFIQFNPYIHSGFRPYMGACACSCSVVGFHNESLNVWIHLAGIAFAFYGIVDATLWQRQADGSPSFALLTVATSLIFIYASSCWYHLFMATAKTREEYARILGHDVIGATLGISISASTFVFYGYRCTPDVIAWALAIIFAVSTVVTINVAWFGKSARDRFAVVGAHCLLRVAIGLVQLGSKAAFAERYDAFFWHILSFILLMIGGVINITRIPERFFPGQLDYVGNSHQIWHVFTLLSGVVTYFGAVHDLADWDEVTCEAILE